MISEKSIENLIVKSVENNTTEKLGLYPYKEIYQQVKIGNYGLADLISLEYNGDHLTKVILIEVKKDLIDKDTLIQAYRYLTGIRSLLETRGYNTRVIEYEIHLIGQRITNKEDIYLFNFDNVVKHWLLDLSEEGMINFIQTEGVKLIEEGFLKTTAEFFTFIEQPF